MARAIQQKKARHERNDYGVAINARAISSHVAYFIDSAEMQSEQVYRIRRIDLRIGSTITL